MVEKKKSTASGKKAIATPENGIAILAEASWEVCNKIGGIYAVLSTKARQLKDQFGDKLLFIGPDVWTRENESPYFKEKKTILKSAASKLELPWGITIRTGRWDIPGQPQVILINPGETAQHINEVYGAVWEAYGVDSLHAYGDYEEGCVFGVATAIVLKALAAHLKVAERGVVAHYNEWTTGMGLLYTQLTMHEASTLFTTHATSIGRSICGNGKALYEYFDGYNGDVMAAELNMESKHSLEKAAAHAADCFTTVSEVTARECEQLLDIRPQVVTPNGFEPDFVPKTAKYNRLRKDGRHALLSVATALTGKEYGDETFIIGTSGRNEYRNKGLDLFLDTIVRVGEKLSAVENAPEAVAFITVPAWVNEPQRELLQALANGERCANGGNLTHSLHNEDWDPACCRIAQLRAEGRLNRVNVIFVPSYLDGNDGVLNISYYDLLPAFDLTLFPSYYEPWGYTPMESCAFGVPTVTTDKAGFGQWVLDTFKNGLDRCGVYVVARNDSDYWNSCEAIAEAAANYCCVNALERNAARNAAFMTAAKADWSFFIKHYDEAFEIALKNAAQRNEK